MCERYSPARPAALSAVAVSVQSRGKSEICPLKHFALGQGHVTASVDGNTYSVRAHIPHGRKKKRKTEVLSQNMLRQAQVVHLGDLLFQFLTCCGDDEPHKVLSPPTLPSSLCCKIALLWEF